MCHDSTHIHVFLDFTDECGENVSQLKFRPISVFHSYRTVLRGGRDFCVLNMKIYARRFHYNVISLKNIVNTL